jgi:hypothetical protein
MCRTEKNQQLNKEKYGENKNKKTRFNYMQSAVKINEQKLLFNDISMCWNLILKQIHHA